MKGFQSRLPAARWEEGLLCGNGTIGAMVMGWPKEETIYFTHEKLYAPFAPKREPVHTAGHLEAIRRMMLDGRYEEAAEFVVNLSYQEGVWAPDRAVDRRVYRGLRHEAAVSPEGGAGGL